MATAEERREERHDLAQRVADALNDGEFEEAAGAVGRADEIYFHDPVTNRDYAIAIEEL